MQLQEIIERRKKELLVEKQNLSYQILDCDMEIEKCEETLRFLKEKKTTQANEIMEMINSNIPLIEKNETHSGKRVQWKKLIIESLNREKTVLKTSRMIKILFPNATEKEQKEYLYALSSSLHGLCLTGTIRKINSEGKGYLYGLPEWFDGDKLKEEYNALKFNFFNPSNNIRIKEL